MSLCVLLHCDFPRLTHPKRIPRARKDQRRTTCHVLLQVAVSRLHQSAIRILGTQLLANRFHSSRYPAKPADTAHKFDPSKNNHIVFVRKNKFFEVPLAHNGTELSEAELQVYVFERIDLFAYPLTPEPFQANRTSHPAGWRPIWSPNRCSHQSESGRLDGRRFDKWLLWDTF